MNKSKKDDETGPMNPFSALDKTAVVQECRVFNETPLNARRCNAILCKLLYLLQHGELISKTDATDTFFAITKLYQSKDTTLRRLVYLAIKELCLISNNVIIVVSSLTKGMTGRDDIYRPPAIRALCRIIDAGMLQTIERYMKQAIVDKIRRVFRQGPKKAGFYRPVKVQFVDSATPKLLLARLKVQNMKSILPNGAWIRRDLSDEEQKEETKARQMCTLMNTEAGQKKYYVDDNFKIKEHKNSR